MIRNEVINLLKKNKSIINNTNMIFVEIQCHVPHRGKNLMSGGQKYAFVFTEIEMTAGQQVAAACFTTREEETVAAPPPAVHDGRCSGCICRCVSCCFPPRPSGVSVMVKRRNAGRCASHDRYGSS